MFWQGFIAGAVAGGLGGCIVGVVTMSLMFMSKQTDRRMGMK